MKRILTTTDFSIPADNAVMYAAGLAQSLEASLTILNCFHIPLSTNELPAPLATIQEMENSSTEALETLKKKVLEKFPLVVIHIHTATGSTVDEISNYAQKHHMDLIVMGITGAGKFTERLIGSTSTSVVKNTKCPVLIIPKDSQFGKFTKVGLACDLKEILHPTSFTVLKELSQHFGSSLEILNVLKPEEKSTFKKAVVGIKLEHILRETPHSLYFPENKDVILGIEDFIGRHKIDIITMVSRRHNIIEKVFHESNTKRMAFHTHIPLLVIHE